MCEIYDTGDSCQVWVNTWHHARKPRACQACRQVVDPREKYLRHFDVFDGAVNVEYLCQPCGQAAEDFQREHNGLPQTPAGIRYVLRDCLDNGDDDSRRRWQPILDNLDARRLAARKTGT
jgi:hypothetical protein